MSRDPGLWPTLLAVPSERAGRRTLASVCAAVLDAALALLLLLVLTIIATGGGVYDLAGIRISARSAGNPVLILYILLFVRLTVLRAIPFFRLRALEADALGRAALKAADRLTASLRSAALPTVRRLLLWMMAGFLLVKLGNAYWYPGFVSGDDVEIHEMTFRSLFGTDWPIWEIRSPFYPFLIVFPLQAVLFASGERDPAALVFAGRCAVVVLSTAAVWATYRLGALTAGPGYGLAAAALFGMHRLHVTFGGSELPRPVSAVFVAAACLCLLHDARARRAALAGALLAVGAAFRGSELIFVLPAMLHLLLDRRQKDLLLAGAAFILTAALCFGIADWLFWGEPFYSFRHLFRYTIVDRLSSRGYEPFWFYVLALPQWISLPVFVLAIAGCSRGGRRIAMWWLIPLLMLSALPHKEPRYLIPLLPFVSVSAAVGLGRALETIRAVASSSPARAERLALILVVLLAGAVICEVSAWRFRKPAEGITVARYIHGIGCAGAVAFEQTWRAGGRLYLPVCDVTDIDPGRITDRGYLESLTRQRYVEWLVIRSGTPGIDVVFDAGFRQEAVSGAPSYFVARRTAGSTASPAVR